MNFLGNSDIRLKGLQRRSKGYILSLFMSMLFLLLDLSFPGITFAQNDSESSIIKEINDTLFKINQITVDRKNKTINIPCQVNMSRGLIEVVLCTPAGKTHESLLVTTTHPVELQTALLLLGFQPENEIPGDEYYSRHQTPADHFKVFLQWENNDTDQLKPVEGFIKYSVDNNPMKISNWLFRGLSVERDGMDVTSLIVTYYDIPSVLELSTNEKYDDRLFYVNEDNVLPVGTDLHVVLKKTDSIK